MIRDDTYSSRGLARTFKQVSPSKIEYKMNKSQSSSRLKIDSRLAKSQIMGRSASQPWIEAKSESTMNMPAVVRSRVDSGLRRSLDAPRDRNSGMQAVTVPKLTV
mgnify:CR=1 FL=1